MTDSPKSADALEPADEPQDAVAVVGSEDAGTRLVTVPGGIPDVDADLREVARTLTDGSPVKVRIPLHLYDSARQQYVTWAGVKWVVELPLEDAPTFREALDVFIRGWVAAQQADQGKA